jgi:hypothetical protein
MRPLVKSAVQSSSAHMRKLAKDMSNKVDEKSWKPSNSSGPTRLREDETAPVMSPNPILTPPRIGSRPRGNLSTEFKKASTSAPKRVNDIVQAPPQIKHLPRNAKKIVAASGKGKKSDAVVSMAQKAMMEAERENVIQRYRELKERRLKQHQKVPMPIHESGFSLS